MMTWKSPGYEPSRQALLLDRDGVINKKINDGYVLEWSNFDFIEQFARSVLPFVAAGTPLVVVSNQSCVGRGLLAPLELRALMTRMIEELADRGIPISGYVICPHHPESQCACRKPKPGLLFAARDLFGLDLSLCSFIGDSQSDLAAGSAAGCSSFLVDASQPAIYCSTFGRVYNSFTAALDYVSE